MRFSVRTILVSLLLAGAVDLRASSRFVAQEWPETGDAEWTDLGVTGGFYRNTQLQGHLVAHGLHLETVPDFWTRGSDFPYMKRNSAQEVFFVDHMSVTRFLGGYSQEWKHNDNQLPSNDLAYRDEAGTVRYRTELIGPRLQRYIDNGYTEFTIGIENVPWALSRDPSKAGDWGSSEPPADWKEWSAFIEAVCRGIKDAYPEEVVRNLRFKTGNEFNAIQAFTGDYDDFSRYYWESLAAIRKVFPEAPVMPGEFAGTVAGSNGVDYAKLFKELARGRDPSGKAVARPASSLVRSTHSFPHQRDIGPRERVQSAVGSYRSILKGLPASFREELSFEYSQYGVLGSALGHGIDDNGVRSASWQFQTMFRARAAGFLDRCWAWGKSEKVAIGADSTHFLNSTGWLYSVLDHVRDDRAWLVRPRQPFGSVRDVSAAVFTRPDRILLLLASWRPKGDSPAGPETVRLRLPRKDLPFIPQAAQARTMAFDNENSVAGHWRRDLAAADNLRPEFSSPEVPPATLLQMAKDPLAARRMVLTRRSEYESAQQASLTLQPLPDDVVKVRNPSNAPFVELQVLLQPDDLRVIAFSNDLHHAKMESRSGASHHDPTVP
jgi:hypothetical protein